MSIFVDTAYWIASIHPQDQWHQRALEVEALIIDDLVTTEAVLIEVLNYFGGRGAALRIKSARIVAVILARDDIEVVPQSREDFIVALDLYLARADKGYSLTDCLSMIIMRDREMTDVLTTDHHFTQEGFHILL
jgi:predicted nucleic acid-binding protein